MGHRFLHVDMLTQLHSRKGGYGVYIVRGGDGYGIDVFMLFLQHFPEILVVFRFWEFLDGSGGLAVIDIAEGHYIHFPAAVKIPKIVSSFAACSDGCDGQPVAGGNKSFSQHMAGNDKED